VQIEALAIYSRRGDRRVVRFHGGLNIITGWSSTGKSSILDMTEFCLGRTDPIYPVGVLTETVSWFAAQLEHDGAHITVARPAPGDTSAGVHNAMIRFGVTIDELSSEELVPNTDARTIRTELSRLLGILPNQVRPGTLTQPPLAATASQALLLCFQGQGEIANKGYLFHRSDNRDIANAIRDTLPYFVGAIPMDTITRRQELEERRKDLRRAEARLARAKDAQGREVEGASALLAEASVLGLTDPRYDPRGPSAIAELTRLRNLDADSAEFSQAMPTDSVLTPLRDRQQDLTGQLAVLEHRLALLRDASGDRAAYGEELTEQRRRLLAVDLVTAGGDAEPLSPCPVCGQPVTDEHAEVRSIQRDLAELDAQLGDLRGTQPAAADRLGGVEATIRRLREELQGVNADIDAALRASAELAETRGLRSRQDFLLGRVTEFLSGLPTERDEIGSLQRDVERREAEILELEEGLDPASFRERTESLFRVISGDVTTWARALRLGYSENGIQIDPNALTVVADTRQGPVELERMGSAANVMGYHVAAHLALHKWFIDQDRPVPSFMILDQPSQVFFPDDVRRDEDERVSDEDRQRITDLYALLRDTVSSLAGRLQIIVVDHANLDLAWFQDSVVENWRHGAALVPAKWLDSN
jgi:hypothetical protein